MGAACNKSNTAPNAGAAAVDTVDPSSCNIHMYTGHNANTLYSDLDPDGPGDRNEHESMPCSRPLSWYHCMLSFHLARKGMSLRSVANAMMLAEYKSLSRGTAHQEREGEDVLHSLGKVLVVHYQFQPAHSLMLF